MNEPMTFNRARGLLHHKKVPHVLPNGEVEIRYVKLSKKEIQSIIDELEDEYTPIIEMSKYGHALLFEYLEERHFEYFVQEIWVDEVIRERLYGDLSIEDIMIAWLYPDCVVEI